MERIDRAPIAHGICVCVSRVLVKDTRRNIRFIAIDRPAIAIGVVVEERTGANRCGLGAANSCNRTARGRGAIGVKYARCHCCGIANANAAP